MNAHAQSWIASFKKNFNLPRFQPRSQSLSSPHPKGNEGRKTLVQTGHVPPKKWEITKKQRKGDVTKSQFCLSLTHYARGKFV